MGHRLRPTRRRVSVVIPLALTLAVGGLAACDHGILTGVIVDNRTDLGLRFEIVLHGRGMIRLMDTVAPHGMSLVLPAGLIDPGPCTTEPLVAFSTQDELEVARHDEPLCVGDAWVIEESDLRSPATSVASARQSS